MSSGRDALILSKVTQPEAASSQIGPRHTGDEPVDFSLCISLPLVWKFSLYLTAWWAVSAAPHDRFFLSFFFFLILLRCLWHATVLLPGKSHGWRSLVGYSPWGCEESDTTEWLHFHFSLSCIGEENGNPLQYSCLENPRDGGAWWAAVYGVAQSRTWLKQFSSSSSSKVYNMIWLKHLYHNIWSPL